MTSIFKRAKEVAQHRRCFSLGQPEAEAETKLNDSLSIKNLFVDEMHAIEALNNGKFIISGRKGTGKSAIKSYIVLNSSPEYDCLRSAEIKPDLILSDLLKDEIPDFSLRVSLMSQWCIISTIINLILDSGQGVATPEIQNLNKLRKKYLDLFKVEDIVKYGRIEHRKMSVNLLKALSVRCSLKKKFVMMRSHSLSIDL